MNRILIIALTGFLTIGLMGCGTASYLETADSAETTESEDTGCEDTSEESSGETAESRIVVQVAGAVNSPGVFSLAEGSRVADAIDAAGGLREDADGSNLNLAEYVSDAQKITVYTVAECETMELEAMAMKETNSSGVDAEGRIDLNTASKEQLMTLSGIGETKANAIIEYREANGPFSDISQVKNIGGIKDGVYAQIEDNITVS